MIYDKIANRATYSCIPGMSKVLDYMASVDPKNFPTGRAVLDGDKIFVNAVTFDTKPEEECLVFEAHKRYADIHYIAEGSETIRVKDVEKMETVDTPYSQEKDIGFYKAEGGMVVTLNAGDFLVCYPQDAHKVFIATDGPTAVKKLVGKILL